MKRIFILLEMALATLAAMATNNTLVAFYSYTNHCREIVETLTNQIDADVLEIEPAEKGLDYEANNYRIGSAQIGAIKANPELADSYPAIDPVEADLGKYGNIIIVAPLWWSQMAAPMQTFLFNYGEQMADKNIGLIVSSHSSGIGSVVEDCKRLIPEGKYFSKNLWINNANHSNRTTLVADWLKDIDINTTTKPTNTMYISIDGKSLMCSLEDNTSTQALLEKLKEGNITYEAYDYGNFEKVGDLGFSLPENNEQINTAAGDVILYTGNNLCLYYGENQWSFTRIGKIEGIGTDELKRFLKAGEGNVKVTLSLTSSKIEQIRANESAQSKEMYSVKGQRLSEPPRGVYIMNGRKKIAKPTD